MYYAFIERGTKNTPTSFHAVGPFRTSRKAEAALIRAMAVYSTRGGNVVTVEQLEALATNPHGDYSQRHEAQRALKLFASV